MGGLGVQLLLNGQIKENTAWAWSHFGGGHRALRPSQTVRVIAVSFCGCHLDTDRESIYLTVV